MFAGEVRVEETGVPGSCRDSRAFEDHRRETPMTGCFGPVSPLMRLRRLDFALNGNSTAGRVTPVAAELPQASEGGGALFVCGQRRIVPAGDAPASQELAQPTHLEETAAMQ